MDALEQVINVVAVEPVSVKRTRGALGDMTWELTKEPEKLVREKHAEPPKVDGQADPLNVLKLRFASGEIGEDEVQEAQEGPRMLDRLFLDSPQRLEVPLE